jgi:hypothetical protein
MDALQARRPSVPTEIVAAYDALLERAFRCASLGTYNHYDNPEFARLSIDGDKATLRTVAAVNDYDRFVTEPEYYTFDADLLSLAEAEMVEVEVAASREAARRRADADALAQRQREAAERAQFEQLRQKYGAA